MITYTPAVGEVFDTRHEVDFGPIKALDASGTEQPIDKTLAGSVDGWLVTVVGEGLATYNPTTRLVTFVAGSTAGLESLVTVQADADPKVGADVFIAETISFTPGTPPVPLAVSVGGISFSAPRIHA